MSNNKEEEEASFKSEDLYILYTVLRLVAGGEYEELALYKVLSPSHLILGPSQPCQRQKLHIYTIEM